MKFRTHLLLLFSLLHTFAYAGYLPVKNYTVRDYNAGTQNWDMDQDKLGRIYIGNRSGLLCFDGSRWNLHTLPNSTTVRSVYVDDATGRIYAGGFGEFGYFSGEGKESAATYHTLTHLLPGKQNNITEVWNIFRDNKGGLWFQSDYIVARLSGKRIQQYKIDGKVTASAVTNGGNNVMIGTEDGRLLCFDGGRFAPMAGSGILSGNRICSILEFEGSVLVATSLQGLYIVDTAGIRPFRTQIDSFIKENQLFCAVSSGDCYAFGTVNDGAVIADFRKGKMMYVNRRTGLHNNTVLNMGFDNDGSLWMCLDNGLGIAFPQSAVTNLLGPHSDSGAGYASMLTSGQLLLGTNQALYRLPWPIAESAATPKPEKIFNGQVWSIDTVGNSLFVGSDRGLFVADSRNPSALRQIPGISGTWSVRGLNRRTGYAIASTYNKFQLLRQTPAGWEALGPVAGYDDAGGRFEFDSEGYLWLGHWLKGVYRLNPDIEGRRFTEVKLFTEKEGLPSNRNNTVVIVGGSPVIATEYGVYRILPGGKAVRDGKLSKGMPEGDAVHLSPLPGDRIFAFSTKMARLFSKDQHGNVQIDSLSLRIMGGRLIPGSEHVGVVDGKYLVGSQDGFYLVDPEKQNRRQGKWRPKVFVASIVAGGDSVIYTADATGKLPEIKIPHSLNSLRFELAYPEYRDESDILFSYLLEDYDSGWTVPAAAPSKEYTQLSEGNYVLHIRAFNPSTGESSEGSFSFTVLPPWWRSVPAKIIYLLVTAVCLYFAFRMLKDASTRAARRIEKRNEEEMNNLRAHAEREALRKDYEIAALKSEQLEQDVKHKSSELSNITMNVIRKNEILLNISSRLEKLEKQAEASGDSLAADIGRIRRSISHNISHDDDWKNFNQNFDIVYENYTKRLMELHPDLSKTELRICCYLKMGLSSKDIAPLFNITPRSVEMSRYRLRKKMQLEREVNLTSYLQGI